MTIKLIALDIDDTLLSSNQEILPSTKKALSECLAKGIKVVLCTGRPLAGVAHFLKELGVAGDDQYVVTYNGAIIESVTGKVLAKELISKKGFEALTEFAQAHKVPFNVLDENSNIYTADHDVDFITVVQAMENSAGLFIRQPSEMPADFEITKGLFVGPKELLDSVEPAVKEKFGQDYYVVRAGTNFLEAMNPAVDKGKALTTLGKKIGIKTEEMMAFGDEGNDLPMFNAVGLAVCMGNGSELAKSHANYVTASNDDDGIAKAIAKYVLEA